MDHRCKVKLKTIKLLEDNIGENLDDFWYGEGFLDTPPKTHPWKKELISWTSLRLKTTALWKTTSRELEDKPQTGRK